MTDRIEGLWVALATPLDEAGEVDRAALATHAQNLLRRDCDGVVLFGTTGEGPSFTASERLEAAEALLAAGIPAPQIALGTGCPAIRDTVALTRGALALGITQALILPPYFFRDAPAQGLTDAFAAVLDGVAESRLRAWLYHIPQVSGVAVPPATVAALRARFGAVLAGVKDSSADFAQFRAFRAAAPDVSVVVGNEADIPRALGEGAAGTICGMANIVPDLVRRMFAPAAPVDAMQAAIAAVDGEFVSLLKAALAAATGEAGWRAVRPPLRAADAATGARIRARLSALATEAAA